MLPGPVPASAVRREVVVFYGDDGSARREAAVERIAKTTECHEIVLNLSISFCFEACLTVVLNPKPLKEHNIPYCSPAEQPQIKLKQGKPRVEHREALVACTENA